MMRSIRANLNDIDTKCQLRPRSPPSADRHNASIVPADGGAAPARRVPPHAPPAPAALRRAARRAPEAGGAPADGPGRDGPRAARRARRKKGGGAMRSPSPVSPVDARREPSAGQRRPALPRASPAVPSARCGLASGFGMGPGVPRTQWPLTGRAALGPPTRVTRACPEGRTATSRDR